MKRGWFAWMVGLAVIAAPWVSSSAQEKPPVWLVTGAQAVLTDGIAGSAPRGIMKNPAPGMIFVVVSAEIAPASETPQPVDVGDIELMGRSESNGELIEWDVVLLGIDNVPLDGVCSSYMFPEDFMSGEVSVQAVGGGRITLSREKAGKPALLSIDRSPARLCFAFAVARRPLGDMRFRFGDSEIDLPAPER